MSDSSWDNGGGAPKKKPLGMGMKVLMGCGGIMLLGLVTCTVGGLVVGRMVKKDPEAFGRRLEDWGKGMVQKDWDRLRTVVDQLQTDEGALAVYRANGDLQGTYATAEGFRDAVRTWRPRMLPLPAEVPLDFEHRHRAEGQASESHYNVSVTKMFHSRTIRCRYPSGDKVSATFDGDRLSRLDMD